MNILETIKGWWKRMFTAEVKKNFGVDSIESDYMRQAIQLWLRVYQGQAPWVSSDDGIKTIKFAKFLTSEMARLACLDISVQFDGSRKQFMQNFWNKSVLPRLQTWLEYGLATGSLILKPSTEGVDFVTPDRFQIVKTDGNGNIIGCVFQDTYQQGKEYFTKLEYHSFWTASVNTSSEPEQPQYVDKTFYRIINKVYVSKNEAELGTEISLSDTKWNKLAPETNIIKENEDRLSGMLFGFFKVPLANDIDLDSPLGISVFANAMEELGDLDTAYSRNSEEILNSSRIVLLDDRLTDRSYFDDDRKRHNVHLPLPRYVKNVTNDEPDQFYQEINPTLNTTVRQEGIDNLLSLIGCKCGFSNGYFTLNQKTGMVTATQVEADDRNTIQTIDSIRHALMTCLDELFYAESVFADLYDMAPVGSYNANYDFHDFTTNEEEEKQNWWKYVQAGKVPAWMFFVRFEGMSEEEAKAMSAELSNSEQEQLFKSE